MRTESLDQMKDGLDRKTWYMSTQMLHDLLYISNIAGFTATVKYKIFPKLKWPD